MNDIDPTAGDRELAEEICKLESLDFRNAVVAFYANEPYKPALNVDAVATLIARARAERDAGLRAEIERSQAVNAELLAACKAVEQWPGNGEMPEWILEMVEAAIARDEQPNTNPESQA